MRRYLWSFVIISLLFSIFYQIRFDGGDVQIRVDGRDVEERYKKVVSFSAMDRPFGENTDTAPSRVCQSFLANTSGSDEREKVLAQVFERENSTQGDLSAFTRGSINILQKRVCERDNMRAYISYGDIDNDYLSEVMFYDNLGEIFLYWNNGGSFKKDEFFSIKVTDIMRNGFNIKERVPPFLGLFFFLDIDGDSLNDILFSPDSSRAYITVIKNLGNRSFDIDNPIIIKSDNILGEANSVTSDDINKDGIADFVITVRKSFIDAKSKESYPARIFISNYGKAPYYNEVTRDILPSSEKSLSIAGGSGREPNDNPERVDPDKFLYFEPFVPILHDFNVDGELDLFIAADFAGSRIYFSENGKFVDYSEESNINSSQAGMGAELYDFNGDGLLDIFTTEKSYSYSNCSFDRACNYKGVGNIIFINNGDKSFSASGSWDAVNFNDNPKYNKYFTNYNPGLRETGYSWGFSSLDYNMDGYHDYFIGVGQSSISRGNEDWASNFEKPTLFTGSPDKGWIDSSYDIYRELDILGTTPVIASTDFNGDFRADILIAGPEIRRPHILLNNTKNDYKSAGLIIRGRGLGGSPFNGEGAIIKVKIKNRPVQVFKLPSKLSNYRSYGATSPLILGLGNETTAEVEVKFTSGVEVKKKIYANKINIVREG